MSIHAATTTEATPISPATDLATFDRRFAEMRERLLRICSSLVGPDLAEDAVQDAYLRARDRIGQLHDLERFEAWTTRLAINLCYNRHRSARRQRERLGRTVLADPRHVSRDPALRELIERLPPRERTAIVLHYGHGYQTDEVATMVGTSPTNVRTILFRARARLRRELTEAYR